MLYLASYYGSPTTDESLGYRIKASIGDAITRFITRGRFSHCELVTPLDNGNYLCYSSSIRDKGVRKKEIHLRPEAWVLVPVSNYSGYDPSLHNLEKLEAYYLQYKDYEYDFLGAVGIILGTKQHNHKLFCSEFAAGFLGLQEPWRYHPNLLAALLRKD